MSKGQRWLVQEHVPRPKDAVVRWTGEMKDNREEKRETCPVVASLNPLVERLVGGHQPKIPIVKTRETKKPLRST